MMKRGFRYLGLALLCIVAILLWQAASDPIQVTRFFRAALKEIEVRKQNYYKKKMAECHANALGMASTMVDSALIEQALFIGADTLLRPDRPMRPEVETFASNIENIPVRPWLKKTDFVSPFQKKDTFVKDSLKLKDSVKVIK